MPKTPIEIYNNKLKELKKDFERKHNTILFELKLSQENCKHEFVHIKELFMAMGETMPGKMCTICGLKTRN